jgi:hypothetical protein
MDERGGATAVVSLQKQPGTVEHDGSRRASPPNSGGRKSPNRPLRLPSRCLRSGRATSTGACSSSGPATLAPRRASAAPGRVGTSTQRRDFAADSLQMQRDAITDAIRDCSTGQLRVKPHGCPVHRVRLEVWSDQVGRESLIGWTGAVRPSRRPPARPPQDEDLSSCHQGHTLILRSAERRVSKDARR